MLTDRTTALTSSPAFSGFAVADLAEARRFYGETLGLDVADDPMGFLRLRLGDGRDVLVYESPQHRAASYTILNFPVPDVDAAVDELIARGVTFEQYEGFEQDARGIARGQGPTIAWFTDPSGNVLSVLSTD